MPNNGKIISGKYELGKEIGKGGMSRVFLATDTRVNKVWAVKQVDKHSTKPNIDLFIKKLRKEIGIMERLNHPAIPRITDIIEDNDTINIVMDYVEGEGLDKILKIKGKQSEDDVINWGLQLCDIFEYLHNETGLLEYPIVHRDIKPSNLILQPGSQNLIKILDFGIAEEITNLNTNNQNVEGTRGYMPPEQEVEGTPLDVRSDIYSIGVTLHHLLTGKIPKPNRPLPKLRAVNGIVSKKTEGLEYIINKCTQKNLNERYQSCDELRKDLMRVEELSLAHLRELKNRIIKFSTIMAFVLIFAVTSIGCNIGYNVQVKNNQLTYAMQIYADCKTAVSSSSYVEIEQKLLDIEQQLQDSAALTNDKYKNALVTTVYSLSMWEINNEKDFSIKRNFDNPDEQEAFNNCKSIFDGKFIDHCRDFANGIDEYTDSRDIVLCVSEANAFNILFKYTSDFEDTAQTILNACSLYMNENSVSDDIMLDELFGNEFSEFVSGKGSGFYENEVNKKGWGNDLIFCLNDFANAKQNAKNAIKPSTKSNADIHGTDDGDKYNELVSSLDEYSTVIKNVSVSNLNDVYKYYVCNSAASYLDGNVAVFKEVGVSEEKLLEENSLYSSIELLLDDLVEKNSNNAEFVEDCNNIQLDGVKNNIISEYHPTSSKNT